MADFGNAGIITVRKDIDKTAVHVQNNEYLKYSLTTNAPAPVFAFTCAHRKWLTSSDFPVQKTYTWNHFQKNGDEDNPSDRYGITMLFLGAPAKYTLLVTQCDEAGNVIATLKDLDFESTDPRDFISSSLGINAI